MVVLAFYPRDFTPVCTHQFCSYRDDGDKIEQLGLQMLGISPQSVASHERWAAENGLTVPLLADEDRRVSKLYGVLGPTKVVRRAIFLIDGERVIRYRHVAALGLSYKDAEDLERAVAAVA
jgi:peroxiredoxin Q/BCP